MTKLKAWIERTLDDLIERKPRGWWLGILCLFVLILPIKLIDLLRGVNNEKPNLDF